MQAVEFVAVLRLLLEQALDFLQQIGNLGLEVLRYLGQLAKYVIALWRARFWSHVTLAEFAGNCCKFTKNR